MQDLFKAIDLGNDGILEMPMVRVISHWGVLNGRKIMAGEIRSLKWLRKKGVNEANKNNDFDRD